MRTQYDKRLQEIGLWGWRLGTSGVRAFVASGLCAFSRRVLKRYLWEPTQHFGETYRPQTEA